MVVVCPMHRVDRLVPNTYYLRKLGLNDYAFDDLNVSILFGRH
jgi:hypothetical protein